MRPSRTGGSPTTSSISPARCARPACGSARLRSRTRSRRCLPPASARATISTGRCMPCWCRATRTMPTFDEAFRLFWKSRELIEKMLAMFSPVAPDKRERQKPRAAENRVSQAMFEGHQKNQPPQEIPGDRGRRALHRFRQRGAARQGFRADERRRDRRRQARDRRAAAALRHGQRRAASRPIRAAAASIRAP